MLGWPSEASQQKNADRAVEAQEKCFIAYVEELEQVEVFNYLGHLLSYYK